MRTTLHLDDDVAAMLQQARKERNATFKQVVNDALRQGLPRLTEQAELKTFRTQAVDLGTCHYPNLDKVWDVLEELERRGTGR